jgi:hypothetical protein
VPALSHRHAAAVQKPKLSFDPNPAEVVSTYAADEYIRSNASLDVEGAAFEADTESVAVSLHEVGGKSVLSSVYAWLL